MNQLTVYNNPDFGQVRTTIIDDEPWFVAADVCRCLDIGNPSQALARLDEDEKNTLILNEGIRGNPEKAIVNEPGLYTLVLSSRKPEAKSFKRWITHEVLPAIRKTGQYGTEQPTVLQRDLTVDDYLKAASIVSSCRNSRLPYVLYFLGRGGFATPRIEATIEEGIQATAKKQRISCALHSKEAKVHTVPTVQEMACEFIRSVRDLGYTYESISQLTGAHRACICRYAHNDKRPGAERAQHIIDVLSEVLRQTMVGDT